MARLLNLSRAARLVGVTRVALQKKISDGTLEAFEGMVTEDGLLRAFPNVSLEDDSGIERLAQAKIIAHYARAAERLPSKEVLAARLTALARDLSDARSEARRYRNVIEGLEGRLQGWDGAGEDLQAAAATLLAWLHRVLQDSNRDPAGFRNLTIRDSFLRIMASHVQLRPSGREFFVDGADTLLEAALRAGISLNYGCSDGTCGRCKARVLAGQLMPTRPHDAALSTDEQAAGYALMCCNTAVSDVVIEATEAAAIEIPRQRVVARVRSIAPLGESVRLLQLKTLPTGRLRFLAGQRAVLRIGESLTAELPIAGCPCDDGNLPFHVPRRSGNYFSEYVWNELKVGDAVTVEGPDGDFVLRPDSARKLIFLAFGIGFAAVKGLLEQAVALDAADSIHLYWIAPHESDRYFANWPRAMVDALDNFRYTPLVSKANLETAGGQRAQWMAALLQPVVGDHPDLAASDVYLAGPESIVAIAKDWLVEQGLPLARLAVATRLG